MAKAKKMTYEKAMAELQELTDQLQNEEIGIDQLSQKIIQAKELILFCREKLRSTEEELDNIFEMDEF